MSKYLLVLGVLFGMFSSYVSATPSSTVYDTISGLKPQIDGFVYVYMTTPEILCGTNVFVIEATTDGGRSMYAAALAALMSRSEIIIEAKNSTGCTDWGTKLQSLIIRN